MEVKMKELKDLRKEKEKHFLMEDGSIVAQMYDDNIHYKDNNQYKEIDNTLIKKNDFYYNKNKMNVKYKWK